MLVSSYEIGYTSPCAAKVVTDRVSGYSKGFGFVRYATTKEAETGIKGMDGQVCQNSQKYQVLLMDKF